MNRHRTLRRSAGCTLVAGALLAAAAAPAAQADLLAAFDTIKGGGNLDVVVTNVTTRQAFPLPAGINTAAPEYGPTLSPDGRRLALVREEAGGIRRILVFDLARGQNITPANLAPSGDENVSPVFSLDGRVLLFGRHGTIVPRQQNPSLVESRSLPASGFRRELSSGQFSISYDCAGKETVNGNTTFLGPCKTAFSKTMTPSAGFGDTPTVAWTQQDYYEERPNEVAASQIVIRRFGSSNLKRDVRVVRLDQGEITQRPGDDRLDRTSERGLVGHPAVTEHSFAVFEFRREIGQNIFGAGDLRVMDLNTGAITTEFFRGLTGQSLGVNTPADEHMPAWSPDGRLLGFLRAGSGRLRLVLYDSETLQALDPAGIDLGPAPSDGTPAGKLRRQFGNLSLAHYAQPPQITCPGGCENVSINLGSSPPGKGGAGTGATVEGSLLVQRITGTTLVFGRSSPKLKTIGTLPLGRRKLDRRFSFTPSFRVGGRPLADGKYRLTVQRLIPGKGKPGELSAPLDVTLRGARIVRSTKPPPRLCLRCKR